jgi:hypothetical protein
MRRLDALSRYLAARPRLAQLLLGGLVLAVCAAGILTFCTGLAEPETTRGALFMIGGSFVLLATCWVADRGLPERGR